ncbi:WD40 repeat domain-containing serine/threonine protein kinase [Thermogemmatispora onikobensis]|uniref:WD40 repeat domain-containing serine/threonine protein kinase n=1 Tax=Thermogemmatispora onikobensis TaxID=732234 RepID=UPI0008529D64|nr:serine/threonine-protein kinase [Thermogemmatispora onikobensis]
MQTSDRYTFCPTCGAANSLETQVCQYCQASLSPAADPAATADPSSTQGAPIIIKIESDVEAQPVDSRSLVPLWPGMVLRERYHILRILGRGGSGAVYEASDLHEGERRVAIKEIVAFHLEPRVAAETIASFYSEASLLATLRHPSLPEVYEYFTEQDCCYLVMEFIQGETLEERLQRSQGGRLPLDEALEIAVQLCTVLEYLHSRPVPIIFRDLKPANIMLDSVAGRVCLIDFGIARRFKPGQSRDTLALGSPGYAAPEQYGRAQSTPQADIYGLGATLHQMLTGVDPSEAPLHFVPLRSFDPALPPELDELVAHMVEISPQKRPASAAEVRRQLESIRHRLPRTRRASSRGQSQQPSPAPGKRRQPGAQPSSAGPSAAAAPSAPALPRRLLLIAGPFVLGAVVGIFGARELDLPLIPASANLQTPTVFARTPAANLLSLPRVSVSLALSYRGHQAPVRALAFSSDGQYLASGDLAHAVHIWEPLSGELLLRYDDHRAAITSLAWLPGTSVLASSSEDGTVQVWDVAQQRRLLVYRGHRGAVRAVKGSTIGLFASGGVDGSVQVWDASTGARSLLLLDESRAPISALSWSPATTILASADEQGNVLLWETRNAALSARQRVLDAVSGQPVALLALAWSPDGSQLAGAGADGQVVLISLQGSAFLGGQVVSSSPCTALAWSPDSRLLLVGSGNQATIWLASTTAYSPLYTYEEQDGSVAAVDWSLNGGLLASTGGKSVRVWSVSSSSSS